MVSAGEIDVREVIRTRAVEIHFQPIASIRRKALVGMEALTRYTTEDGTPVPPNELFARAAEEGVQVELDRVCREATLRQFRAFHAADPTLVLFANCDGTAFDADASGPEGWAEAAKRAGIDPRNVAIEILESERRDVAAMREAVRRYRESGFLVVMDDVGVGHSNLERIAFVKPDMIKADRTLVRDLHEDFHTQAVFRALVELSERIGGWVVTEGVELEEQALMALDLGGDMFQGFYFARPERADSPEALDGAMDRVLETAARFKHDKLEQVRFARERHEERTLRARVIAARLEGLGVPEAEEALARLIRPYPQILSACLLDDQGIQVTETVLNLWRVQRQKTVIFRPPPRGADHSLREYYYLVMEAGIDPFETQPYVPLPTGDLCVTVSTRLRGPAGSPRVLCLHVRAEMREVAQRGVTG